MACQHLRDLAEQAVALWADPAQVHPFSTAQHDLVTCRGLETYLQLRVQGGTERLHIVARQQALQSGVAVLQAAESVTHPCWVLRQSRLHGGLHAWQPCCAPAALT